MQRRVFLTATGVAYLSSLGGCVSADDTAQSPAHTTSSAADNSPPADDTQTPTEGFTPSVSDLSFTANVRNQASTEEPPTIEIALTNTAAEPVEIEYGAALLFSDDAGVSLEWADEIAIQPDDRGAFFNSRPERTDGCWSVPSDDYLSVISIVDSITLDTGEQLTETVFVYDRSETKECYPSGSYRFEDALSFTSTESEFVIALQISVGNNGEITANGEQPYFVSD